MKNACGAAILLCVLAHSALASDGRIEINQAIAAAGGVNGSLVEDPLGLPVVITVPGSYVLTGDLTTSDPDQLMIDVRADDVTLDLNGFAIRGPQTCDPGGSCATTGSGLGIVSFNTFPDPANTTVRNGTITGFSGALFLGGEGVLLERLAVSHCTGPCIVVGPRGLVIENRVRNARSSGISMGTDTGFRDNVVTSVDVTGSGSVYAFDGGRAIGGNLCDDGSCNPNPGSKRYYLTPNEVAAADATTSCAHGFSMASLAQLHDTSALTYDRLHGQTWVDAGTGPPTTWGWIRTGYAAVSGGNNTPGTANCAAWNGASATNYGTRARPMKLDWTAPADASGLWEAGVNTCAATNPVWCIED